MICCRILRWSLLRGLVIRRRNWWHLLINLWISTRGLWKLLISVHLRSITQRCLLWKWRYRISSIQARIACRRNTWEVVTLQISRLNIWIWAHRCSCWYWLTKGSLLFFKSWITSLWRAQTSTGIAIDIWIPHRFYCLQLIVYLGITLRNLWRLT